MLVYLSGVVLHQLSSTHLHHVRSILPCHSSFLQRFDRVWAPQGRNRRGFTISRVDAFPGVVIFFVSLILMRNQFLLMRVSFYSGVSSAPPNTPVEPVRPASPALSMRGCGTPSPPSSEKSLGSTCSVRTCCDIACCDGRLTRALNACTNLTVHASAYTLPAALQGYVFSV